MGSQEDCAASRRQEEGKVMLTSNDGEVFEVEAAAARQSVLLQNMMELGLAADGITLQVVSGHVLALAVAYVSRHSKTAQGRGDEHRALKDFDKDLVKGLDDGTLFDLLSAADYMDIKGLYELTCQTVADMIANKTIEEVRQIFNIQNDYTPEEEAQVLEEISWALN